VEVQFEVVLLALVQWARQSVANQSLDLEFHIGVQMVMKQNLRLLKMAQ
jgi:hypothetical protein